MSEENKRLGREFYESINQGRLEVIDSHVADNFVDHEEFPGLTQDKKGVRAFFQIMRTAFPDFHMTVEDLMAEGDKVIARLTMSGTHRGEFMGMPATGKKFEVSAIDIVRVVDGKAVEHWGVSDTMKMMQQLGAIPGQ